MQRLVLRAGTLEAQIAPQVGGSIARFDRVDGVERMALFRGRTCGNQAFATRSTSASV